MAIPRSAEEEIGGEHPGGHGAAVEVEVEIPGPLDRHRPDEGGEGKGSGDRSARFGKLFQPA